MVERFGCLGIILIVLALIFAVAKFSPPSPQIPLPPATWAEYNACIAEVIAECIRDGIRGDLKKSREELPVMPTRGMSRLFCWNIAKRSLPKINITRRWLGEQ